MTRRADAVRRESSGRQTCPQPRPHQKRWHTVSSQLFQHPEPQRALAGAGVLRRWQPKVKSETIRETNSFLAACRVLAVCGLFCSLPPVPKLRSRLASWSPASFAPKRKPRVSRRSFGLTWRLSVECASDHNAFGDAAAFWATPVVVHSSVSFRVCFKGYIHFCFKICSFVSGRPP